MTPECNHFLKTTKERIIVTTDVEDNDLLVSEVETLCRICQKRVALLLKVIERKPKPKKDDRMGDED